MNVDSVLKALLESLGHPAARLYYAGKAETYYTFQLIFSGDDAFRDDAATATTYTYRIDLFSRSDYIDLLEKTRAALKMAGWHAVEVSAEQYEDDTGYYHVSIDAEIMKEVS